MGGGKGLRYKKRRKFVPEMTPQSNEAKPVEEKVTDEEHEKRMKLLKEMGILKE